MKCFRSLSSSSACKGIAIACCRNLTFACRDAQLGGSCTQAYAEIFLVQVSCSALSRLPATEVALFIHLHTSTMGASCTAITDLNFSLVCATWSFALKKALGAKTLLPDCSSFVPPLAGAQVGRCAVVIALLSPSLGYSTLTTATQ